MCIWMLFIFGLTCFTISILGNLDVRYSGNLRISSYIHIFSNSALINPSNSKDYFRLNFMDFWEGLAVCAMGIFSYFLQRIFLLSWFQAITVFEYSFCLRANSFLSVGKDGKYVKEDPRLKDKETTTFRLKIKKYWL